MPAAKGRIERPAACHVAYVLSTSVPGIDGHSTRNNVKVAVPYLGDRESDNRGRVESISELEIQTNGREQI